MLIKNMILILRNSKNINCYSPQYSTYLKFLLVLCVICLYIEEKNAKSTKQEKL
jgi:hypothetical protein